MLDHRGRWCGCHHFRVLGSSIPHLSSMPLGTSRITLLGLREEGHTPILEGACLDKHAGHLLFHNIPHFYLLPLLVIIGWILRRFSFTRIAQEACIQFFDAKFPCEMVDERLSGLPYFRQRAGRP
jgi:hypothetical protein